MNETLRPKKGSEKKPAETLFRRFVGPICRRPDQKVDGDKREGIEREPHAMNRILSYSSVRDKIGYRLR